MFYTLSSRLLVPPNTIFVTDHTTGYFVNVLPDLLIVILSLECYILICIDWLYVHFTALCFSHVEVRFDISVIKELIDWLKTTLCSVSLVNNTWPQQAHVTPISVCSPVFNTEHSNSEYSSVCCVSCAIFGFRSEWILQAWLVFYLQFLRCHDMHNNAMRDADYVVTRMSVCLSVTELNMSEFCLIRFNPNH